MFSKIRSIWHYAECYWRFQRKIMSKGSQGPIEPRYTICKCISKDHDRQHTLFAVMFSKSPSRWHCAEWYWRFQWKRYSKYILKDVFPKKLPEGLHYKWAHNFRTDLKKATVPQKKDLYRLSPAELEKLKQGTHRPRIHKYKFKTMGSTCSLYQWEGWCIAALCRPSRSVPPHCK